MPRFSVLHHDWPAPHFDFLLENEATLLTWRLSAWPAQPADTGQSEPTQAERIDNHRSIYLDYEGPVSQNRGSVRRIDTGTFVEIESTASRLVVLLDGQFGRCRLTLPATGSGPVRSEPV